MKFTPLVWNKEDVPLTDEEVQAMVLTPEREREYECLVETFGHLMTGELRDNDFKGGPTGWTDDLDGLIRDAYYHVGKLQEAVRGGAAQTKYVDEFCADVANLGLIIWYARHNLPPRKPVTFDHDGHKITAGKPRVHSSEDGRVY